MSTDRPESSGAGATTRARIVSVDDESGQRLDNFLVRVLKGVPKSRIYRMIRKGEVRVNGGRSRPTYRVQAGDRIRIPPARQPVEEEIGAFIGDRLLARLESAILFEDERLLVVDKPAGLAVHGGSGVAVGVIEAFRRLRPQADLELVHRLDRDTSGCLLLAKRRSTLRSLHALIREGRLGKSYRLIVHGQWPADLDRVMVPLSRFVTPSGERRVRVDPAGGRASLTAFELIAHADAASLLQAALHTGRTHQIRVHCQAAGYSIVGDEKYASADELARDRALGIHRLCLHAHRLSIPTDGGERVFEAPLPADFVAAWQRLERSAAENG